MQTFILASSLRQPVLGTFPGNTLRSTSLKIFLPLACMRGM
jgi:hypothetical protein